MKGPMYGMTSATSTESPMNSGSSIRRLAYLYVQKPRQSQSTNAKKRRPLRIACDVPELMKLARVTGEFCRLDYEAQLRSARRYREPATSTAPSGPASSIARARAAAG